MKLKNILFLIFIVPFIITGQNRKIDSLRRLLKTNMADTSRINVLLLIGNRFQDLNADTAIYFHKQAEALSQKTGDELREAWAKMRLGWDYSTFGNYELALSLYDQALALSEKYIPKNKEQIIPPAATAIAKKIKPATLICMGVVYSYQGNNAKALASYFGALKIHEETVNQKGISETLNYMGSVYKAQGNYSKALEHNLRALKIDEKRGDIKSTLIDLGNLGNIYRAQRNMEKALDHYQRALKIALQLENKNHIAILYGNIGGMYYMQKDNSKALEYYFKALKLETEFGRKQKIAAVRGNIGQLYTATGKYKDAERELKTALAIAIEINSVEMMKVEHESLSDLYDKMKLYQPAFEHYKKYIAARDTINSEENQKKQVRTEMNYEFEKKEAVMVEQQEKERVIAEEQNRRQQIVILAVGIGLLFVVVFAGFVFRSLKTTRHQKQIIEEKQKEILDSIRYAKRIQQSLLPNERYFAKSMARLMKL